MVAGAAQPAWRVLEVVALDVPEPYSSAFLRSSQAPELGTLDQQTESAEALKGSYRID
jgi:hypothetical protein